VVLAFYEKVFRIAADLLTEIAVPARAGNDIEQYQDGIAAKNKM
jgi:hypothetical protein